MRHAPPRRLDSLPPPPPPCPLPPGQAGAPTRPYLESDICLGQLPLPADLHVRRSTALLVPARSPELCPVAQSRTPALPRQDSFGPPRKQRLPPVRLRVCGRAVSARRRSELLNCAPPSPGEGTSAPRPAQGVWARRQRPMPQQPPCCAPPLPPCPASQDLNFRATPAAPSARPADLATHLSAPARRGRGGRRGSLPRRPPRARRADSPPQRD
jgi:hypothetical protein